MSRFKNNESFSVKLGEDINERIAVYMEASLDCKLIATQEHKYFKNLFEDDTRRFYRSYVQLTCTIL